MKIVGKPFLAWTVANIIPGEQFYIRPESIQISTKGNLYIDPHGQACKSELEQFEVPIKKLSQQKNDYEIDLNLPFGFFPIAESAINKKWLGPFPLETINPDEVTNEELWNRMRIDELEDQLKYSENVLSKEGLEILIKTIEKKEKEFWESIDDLEILNAILKDLSTKEKYEKILILKKIIEGKQKK
ncbi:MAG TPA: hypothetical protein PKD96_03900 [Candidatus Absconditabacterales bacterium]|nr:hypothetical protein [Candidatus Absconditabacterales bacterium]HMT27424.1 hypothetical protein [Candidatus Absconditabacterales bacterium]